MAADFASPARRSRSIRLGVLLAALALLLAWFVGRPPPTAPAPTPVRAAAPEVESAVDRRTHPAAPAPPADEPDPNDARAHKALAEALGYVWVECPEVEGMVLQYPEDGHELIAGGGYAVSAEEGVATLREQIVYHGGDSVEYGAVKRALRWTTGPTGVTDCREEPLARSTATVHVVDEDGAPREVGLTVSFGQPDRINPVASTYVVDVYNDGPVWVEVNELANPEWTAPRLAVHGGDVATLVVRRTRDATREQAISGSRRRLLATATTRWRVAEALARDERTDPTLRPALARLAASERFLVDYRSQWFDANGDPADGEPMP